MKGSPVLPPAKLSLQAEGTASNGGTDDEESKTEFASEKYNIGKLGLKKVLMQSVFTFDLMITLLLSVR